MSESPIQNAMDMAIEMQKAQFNLAKLTISWQDYGHVFTVESMNPLSAFELSEKVKEIIKIRYSQGGMNDAKRRTTGISKK